MSRLVIAIALVAGACMPGDGDDGGGALDHGGFLVAPGMEEQGTHLLGEQLDTLAGAEPGLHVSFDLDTAADASGRPIRLAFHGGAALRSGEHRGKDPFFDGVILTADNGSQLELSIDRDKPGGRDVAVYRLRHRASPGEAWTDPCLGRGALPLAGTWRRSGTHELAARRVSFACENGTAYKCVRFSYVPGADPKSQLWQAHQACTRMLRGDYCANGSSHTREGTVIRIYDNLEIAPRPSTHPEEFMGLDRYPPPVDQPVFEAIWPVGDEPAICLGRLRWQALPLRGACEEATSLPHPTDGISEYCEDLGADDSGEVPPRLFNSSAYSDLALHVWRQGDDRVSTVRGYFDPSLPEGISAPFPNFGVYTHAGPPEGLLLRRYTGSADPAAFVEVHMYRHPGRGDNVIAPADAPPPGYNDLGLEGYVRREQPINEVFQAFKLYRHPTTGDLWSTTLEREALAAGYVEQSAIGYVRGP